MATINFSKDDLDFEIDVSQATISRIRSMKDEYKKKIEKLSKKVVEYEKFIELWEEKEGMKK